MEDNSLKIILSIIGRILIPSIFFILIFYSLRLSKRKEKFFYEVCNPFQRNLIFVGFCIVLSIVFGAILYIFNMIQTEGKARVDLVIAIGIIIGIIGAVWALFARIDAERAFRQSEKTYKALGATFDFITILDEDKFPSVVNKMDTSGSKISLYIGFPCVAFLFIGKDKLGMKPIDVFKKLIRKLEDIQDKIDRTDDIDYTFKIGYFEKNLSLELLNGLENVNSKDKIILISHLEKFYGIIEKLYVSNHSKITLVPITLIEKFRYITINCPSSSNGEVKERKAYNWVISNLQDKDKKTTKQFDSMVFQTSEEKFVRLLEDAF